MDSFFPVSYEDSRSRFLHDVEQLRVKWPSYHLESYPLKNFPDLSIDWLWAEPPVKNSLVIVSTAEHGIEGYVGSAMLKLFVEEFALGINPETTGLLLIHAINPWGMEHHYRVNPQHVDLNRNVVFEGHYSSEINSDYDLIASFLNPQRPVRTLSLETIPFLVKVIRNMIHPGKARVQAASLLGQHRHPKGIYFGGTELQEETALLIGLYRKALADYQNVVQIDIHTGYGPRDQMTMIVPPLDPLSSVEAAQKFRYPLVQKIDVNEFYAISGDMGEYVYRLRDSEFPRTKVFVCGFEFGTFGASLPALIRSLRITILENQLRHFGAVDSRAAAQICAEYEELFFPSEPAWREKALADGRQAFEGILTAFRIFSNPSESNVSSTPELL